MRDDDRLLDLAEPKFGSGVIGVCDVCGTRQAVVVLSKERFKLCVLDFLNKTWLKTDKKPGAPAPVYRSERVWFDTTVAPAGRAPAVVLSPTKVVKHPVVLVTPDIYGITTTLLDGAIRFAREGFEVLIPDLLKTTGVSSAGHLATRGEARFRGGVPVESKRVAERVRLFSDALDYLRGRDMVDPARSALFGTSYGGSLAVALGARDTRLAAVALAYPMPVRPAGLPKLLTAPVLMLGGTNDRMAQLARAQFEDAHSGVSFEFLGMGGARHHFLARDLGSYDLEKAEEAWSYLIAFLKRQLMPPPPKPPTPPAKPAAPAAPPPAKPPSAAPAAAVPSTASPTPAAR